MLRKALASHPDLSLATSFGCLVLTNVPAVPTVRGLVTGLAILCPYLYGHLWAYMGIYGTRSVHAFLKRVILVSARGSNTFFRTRPIMQVPDRLLDSGRPPGSRSYTIFTTSSAGRLGSMAVTIPTVVVHSSQ